MAVTTRFQPPNNPLSEHTPDAETAQIKRGVGTRSIGDVIRHWQALTLLVLVGAGDVYAAWHLIGWGWPVADVLFWGAVVLVLCSVGAGWVLLRFRQDLWQFTAIKEHNAVKTDVFRRYWGMQRKIGSEWSYRWNSIPQEVVPEVNQKETREQAAAAKEAAARAAATTDRMRADFQALMAQFALAEQKLNTLAVDAKARVAPVEQPTTPLETPPAMPPPRPVDYIGTDLETMMAVVFSGRSPSLPYFKNQDWPRSRWEAAINTLKAAGILAEQGRGKGFGLAPDFARDVAALAVDGKHDMAETWLARNPSPTSTVARSKGPL